MVEVLGLHMGVSALGTWVLGSSLAQGRGLFLMASAMQRTAAVLILATASGTACTEHPLLPKSRQGVKVFPNGFFSMETSL